MTSRISENRKLCVCGICVHDHICAHTQLVQLAHWHCSCGVFNLLLRPSSGFCSHFRYLAKSRTTPFSRGMKNGSRVHIIKAMQAFSREIRKFIKQKSITKTSNLPRVNFFYELVLRIPMYAYSYPCHILQGLFLNMQYMYLLFWNRFSHLVQLYCMLQFSTTIFQYWKEYKVKSND